MQKPKGHVIRTAVVGSLFMLWLAVIGARAGYLQLYKGAWLSQKAAGQYERELILQGKRGTIYDSRHEAMAVSIETTSIAAYPALVENQPATAAQLAGILNLKPKEVQQQLASARPFVWIKRQATPKQVSAIKKLGLKGIEFLPEHSRFYPNTTLAAQVMGFTGIDGHGLEGLEFYYDAELKGTETRVTVLKDALGRGFEAHQESAVNRAGNNLILTIDRHIQYITEQALADAVTEYKAQSGMALVMEPQTGALLAVAHYPFFNPNAFSRSDRRVWRNRAVTDPFEPGSTMKIFSAAAALDSGIITAGTIFFCENGKYPVGGHTVHDTKPYGWLSLQQIVKYSSNIGAVKLVEQVGPQLLYDHLQRFGFGTRTRVDSPGESSGALSHYKRWTSVDTGAIAFGQGLSVTALQLITAASALAHDGMLMRPYVVKAITNPDGRTVRTFAPQAVRQVVSPQSAHTVRSIMRTVITEGGTGLKADVAGYSVCGKTGTAQKVDANGNYAQNTYLASFVGFAPTERPAVAVLVIVDEPRDTHYGGLVAAPVFSRIVGETLGYLNVPSAEDPDQLRVFREIQAGDEKVHLKKAVF
ncbi:MAG: penicillin-binding protein 2 [Desulfobacteraceae bacterium]|nr:MAG: penicillin-binding protein 2 [Desulfobacteraceae bacterium]